MSTGRETPSTLGIEAPVGVLESLGKARDGLIVLGALVYGLGFATWSFIAWRRGFGTLPLIDSQYFIGGIAPAGVLGVSAASVYGLHRLVRVRYPQWLEGLSLRRLLLFHGGALVAALIGGVVVFLSDPSRHQGNRALYLIGLGILLIGGVALDPALLIKRSLAWLLASLPAEDLTEEQKGTLDALTEWSTRVGWLLPDNRWLVLAVPIALGTFALWQYAENGYTRLPQSLGGVAIRCVQLDISRNDLSATTLSQLGVAPLSTRDTADVATTPKLQLQLATGEYLLISSVAKAPPTPKLIQLPRSTARALTWCDTE